MPSATKVAAEKSPQRSVARRSRRCMSGSSSTKRARNFTVKTGRQDEKPAEGQYRKIPGGPP